MATLVDPLTASAGDVLASVADKEPGPMLLSVLLMVDRSTLDPDDAVHYLQLHDRVASWWSGLQTEALVAAASPAPRITEHEVLDPRPGYDETRLIRIEDEVREEVSSALRLPPATAQRRIDTARLLDRALPATREALATGDVTPAHVSVIVEAAHRISGRWSTNEGEREAFEVACRELEFRVLPTARHSTVARTRRAADRVVESIDAEGQRRRRHAARCTRDVSVIDEPDGISALVARLDSVSAHAILAAVHAAAVDPRIEGACDASAGERRAEALAALVLGTGLGGDSPGHDVEPGLVVNLDVVIPLDALLGLQGANARDVPADAPAPEVSGRGPIGLEQLQALLDDPAVGCTLRSLVTDPGTGRVVGVGRRRYEVTGPLRRLIVARDRTCRFPGCSRRASLCQIDHAEAWEDGGRTDVDNLGTLCVRHHQMKTHGGWRIAGSRADGSCTWVSPSGRRYEWEPELHPAPLPAGAPTVASERASTESPYQRPPESDAMSFESDAKSFKSEGLSHEPDPPPF